MNSYIEFERIDIKQEEDPLSITESQDIRRDIKTEAEECYKFPEQFDIKHDVEDNLTSINTISEVEYMHSSLQKSNEDYDDQSKNEHNSEEDRNIPLPVVREPFEAYGTHLEKEKYGVCVCDRITENFKKCTVCSNLVRQHNNTDKTASRDLKCNICSRSFVNKTNNTFSKGKYMLSSEKHLTCTFCIGSFSDMYLHAQSHIRRNKILPTCSIFRKSFSHESNLVQHTRTHGKQFPCNVCTKIFSKKIDLIQHTRSHTYEKPFTCNICMKSFSLKSNLARHKRTHTNEKPFTCNICMKSFSLKFILSEHMRTHTYEKPFTCEYCMKTFSMKCNLNRHINTHTNEKRFTCNVCLKSFSFKCSLTRHMSTHTNEKPFTCNICMKSFSQKLYLIRHICKHK